MNCCLQFDQTKRMSWKELVAHYYITKSPESQDETDPIHLSYTEATGHYQVDGKNMNDSAIIQRDPYSNLNANNAIMLNCKDPLLYQDVYKKAVEKHQKKSKISND